MDVLLLHYNFLKFKNSILYRKWKVTAYIVAKTLSHSVKVVNIFSPKHLAFYKVQKLFMTKTINNVAKF